MSRKNSVETNVWDFLTQTFLAAINKGQLIGLCLFFCLMFVLYRMSNDDLSRLIFQTLAHLKSGYLLGYVFFFLAIGGWFFHCRWLRKKSAEELEEVTHERNRLQEQVVSGNIVPSGKRLSTRRKKGV